LLLSLDETASLHEGFKEMMTRPRKSAKIVLFPDEAELEAAKKRVK